MEFEKNMKNKLNGKKNGERAYERHSNFFRMFL